MRDGRPSSGDKCLNEKNEETDWDGVNNAIITLTTKEPNK